MANGEFLLIAALEFISDLLPVFSHDLLQLSGLKTVPRIWCELVKLLLQQYLEKAIDENRATEGTCMSSISICPRPRKYLRNLHEPAPFTISWTAIGSVLVTW